MKINIHIHFPGILVIVLALSSCESRNQDDQNPGDRGHPAEFPPFITPVEEYFDVRLGAIPDIDGDSYQLKISGAVDNPETFSLEDMRNLEMVEKTLTIECIDNRPNDQLLGTATWKEVTPLLRAL